MSLELGEKFMHSWTVSVVLRPRAPESAMRSSFHLYEDRGPEKKELVRPLFYWTLSPAACRRSSRLGSVECARTMGGTKKSEENLFASGGNLKGHQAHADRSKDTSRASRSMPWTRDRIGFSRDAIFNQRHKPKPLGVKLCDIPLNTGFKAHLILLCTALDSPFPSADITITAD